MREIEFRGKRVDNGEWAYGSLIEENYYIDKAYFIRTRNEEDWTSRYYNCLIDVKTIGQYTGLDDRNGTKIFEGDIVRLGTNEIRFVFYGSTDFRHTMYGKYAKEFDYKDKGYEVIGNKYDNPELLEAQDE